MGSSGSSQPAHKTTTRRFAPYIEEAHAAMLNEVVLRRDVAMVNSPYAGYEDIELDQAFLGGYLLSSFPPLYEMFGKFMSGFDIDALWESVTSQQLNKSEINNKLSELTKAESDILLTNELPTKKLKYREINAVNTSSFVIGTAQAESAWLKKSFLVSAQLKAETFVSGLNSYITSLNWQKQVVDTYSMTIKQYYLTAVSTTDNNYSYSLRDALWEFGVLDFERAALGAFNPKAMYAKYMFARARSTISKVLLVLSTTINGACIGAQCGGYVGAIVGGVIGFVVGVAQLLLE